jgi:hypothetical protein
LMLHQSTRRAPLERVYIFERTILPLQIDKASQEGMPFEECLSE